MGTDRLFLDFQNGATPRVLQYVNSTPTQLGNTFGTMISVTVMAATFNSCPNRVVHFCGEVYAVLHDGVYRFNQGPTNFPSGAVPGDWSKVNGDGGLTFTTPPTGDNRYSVSGLHVMNVGGVPHLVGVIAQDSTTSSWRSYKLNSATGAWTESADTGATGVLSAGGGGGISNSIVFRNVLHFYIPEFAGGVGNSCTYDPTSDTFADIAYSGTNPPTFNTYQDFCVFQDRLFQCAFASGLQIFEFTGGVWANSGVQITSNLSGVNFREARPSLFLDPGGSAMVCFHHENSGGIRAQAKEISTSLTVTDRSVALLPVGLRTGGGVGAGSRWESHSDIDTAPTSIDVKLHFMTNASIATARVTYQYTNPTTLITQLDSGGAVGHAGQRTERQGGERFFTAGQLDAKVTNRSGAIGGELITFRAYGDPVVLLHGAVTGGPFQSGETITGGTSGATATVIQNGVYSGNLKVGGVVGTFQNGEVLTGGTSGATATTTAGPTGGAADKKFKLYFTPDGELTLTEAQLALPVTGGAATYNAGQNQVEGVVPDHVTDYTIVWDLDGQAPSVSVGDRVTRYPEVFV